MDILDIWVNLVTERSSAEFLGQEGYANIPGYLGSNQGPLDVDALVALMDELGVATGIFTGGLDRNTDKLLDDVRRAPGPVPRRRRRRRSARPGRAVERIRELAQHPRFSMVRVMPLATQVADQRRSPLSRLPGVRRARDPGRHQRRHPRPAGALQGAAPRAARRRAHRLPRPRGDRRAHGASLRRAAHELHAQVAEPLRVVHRVRAALHGPEPRRVHEHEDVPRPRDLGQRRAVVPDAALARRGARAPARRRRDGAVPRRHRPPPARPRTR